MDLLMTIFCLMCVLVLLGALLYTVQDYRIERRMRDAEKRWEEIKRVHHGH